MKILELGLMVVKSGSHDLELWGIVQRDTMRTKKYKTEFVFSLIIRTLYRFSVGTNFDRLRKGSFKLISSLRILHSFFQRVLDGERRDR